MLGYQRNIGNGFQLWLVFIFLTVYARDSVAWGPEGHRVIGFIAESHLKPGVKELILEKFNINSLADVATWADRIRKKRKEQGPWHYTNIEEGKWTYDAGRDCPDGVCVTEKIHEFSGILADRSADLRERKNALKYLVHFVGDVHQPLHLGNLKDRGGGNLRFPYKGEVGSLHYLWDGGLVDWGKVRGGVFAYASRLNGKISDEEVSTWSLLSVSEWANESRSHALKTAYNVNEEGLSKNYLETSREVIDFRLAQAGIRLAHLLNTILTAH